MATQTPTMGDSRARPKPQKELAYRRAAWLDIGGVYLFLILFSVFILVPFIWPFLAAFTTKPENVSTLYLYWPQSFTLEHFYTAIVGRGQALTLLRNSIYTVTLSVVLALIVCLLGGYALSRGTFRF